MKKIWFYVVIILLITSLFGTVTTLFFYYNSQQLNQQTVSDLQTQVDKQKKEKDTIRNLWEKQAADNDKLILAQQKVIDSNNAYISVVKQSIRFVNGQPDLLPTVSQQALNDGELAIKNNAQNLEDTTKTNVEDKQFAKDTIDALYLQDQQDQANRANPRDGVR